MTICFLHTRQTDSIIDESIRTSIADCILDVLDRSTSQRQAKAQLLELVQLRVVQIAVVVSVADLKGTFA